ncbi:nucleoside-triphosphatase [Enterococcus termitis]|uniref:AAA+ ATPase domain-containing protein n=1 Tax=Enterococcus termitis TaxID=332950 RepID=A0A1E5GI62_9ENTE|nr:nucleoside-triphosphatase [Enterococcus termitis]OEG12379.1 hypothetical protein BCR25_07525 [Enterococcus termitis]OJG98789.1 hypothetical protein RV18_GL002651 [Enterococcus termitis]
MKQLFLEGDKFIGKSTLLQTVLKEMALPVSGFYVERRRDEQKRIIGFELKPASELLLSEKSSAVADHCFIQMKQGKRSRNLTVFETYGCSLLQEARRSKQVILLDEIGGVELLSKSFMKELYLTLNQPQKIIGVFKSDKNYQRQKQHTLESLDIDEQRETLKEAINVADGQIRTLTEQNHQMVEAELRHFLTS